MLQFNTTPDPLTIEEAVALHRRNAKDLGFVVKAFFHVCRSRGELLVAHPPRHCDVVGSCLFHIRRDGMLVIYEIVTSAEDRGKGYGRSMVEELKRIAKQRGAHSIYLKCPEGSEANAFYRRLGFTDLGLIEGKKRRLHQWKLALGGGLFGEKERGK